MITPGNVWSIRAQDAIRVVSQAMERKGKPAHLQSDNGPEFVAYAIHDWLKESVYITPGSPWEQPYIESFHDKFRDECLNRVLFSSLAEARVIVEQWSKEYNQQRPHSSLAYKTPDEFAVGCNRDLLSGSASFHPRLQISAQPDTLTQTRRNLIFTVSSPRGQRPRPREIQRG